MASATFEMEALSSTGIRKGTLRKGEITLATPACFAVTETGSIPHLSPAQAQVLPPHGLVLLLPHFYLSFDAVQLLGGIKKYCAIPTSSWVHFMPGPSSSSSPSSSTSAASSTIPSSTSSASSSPPTSSSSPSSASSPAPSSTSSSTTVPSGSCGYESPSGRFQIDCKQYADILEICKCDSASALTWQISSAPKAVGNNLLQKSVHKTSEWASYLHNQLARTPTLATSFFAPIVGGGDLPARGRSLRDAVALSAFGLEVESLATGESDATRHEILRLFSERTGKSSARLVSGMGTPSEILDALPYGVDIIATDYPTQVTSFGMALVFDFGNARDAEKLNLRDPCFETDPSALLAGCSCYTCRNHSRAYLHHLLNVQEMLAWTLLQLHNWHHYLSWFEDLRAQATASASQDQPSSAPTSSQPPTESLAASSSQEGAIKSAHELKDDHPAT